MKKLFFAICFISFGIIYSSQAAVQTIDEAALAHATPKEFDFNKPVSGMPNPDNLEEVVDFFRNRFLNANVTKAEDMGDLSKNSAIHVQHSEEYIQEMQTQQKSTFEKIYDAAMQRISGEENNQNYGGQTVFYTQNTSNNDNYANVGDNIDVINIMLPDGKQAMVPAAEHIPFLFTSIKILPTGLIQVEEEITVVANGQKLKNGLIKILPKFSTSRSKVRKKIDIDLIEVLVNDSPVLHTLEEIGDKIYIKPQEKYTLAPGVYTYKFNYLLDRKLWYYDDFTEFYWDITGGYLNLVITSANAVVSIPEGHKFLSQTSFIGSGKNLSGERTRIMSFSPNTIGFSSSTPVLPGESLHTLVSLDKNSLLPPDINRKILWLIVDYGDIMFALFGLVAISLSYFISWHHIKNNKSKINTSFKNSAYSMRYFLKNAFDKKSFVAFLLELYKKQYIDIKQQENNILLVKKTDNLSYLSKGEKKALNNMFLGKDSVIQVSNINNLKFKRAYNDLSKTLTKNIKVLNLKLNLTYLFFSIGMLILSEIAISMLGINTLQTMIVLLSSSSTVAFYIYMLRR
ncbi:MAG: DUF2207 domain-containing protein, partial [Alphaproteobacteria bacterium]|nr:DUF2207 domain-containing protein [Alphaproteobacteria bacterium]